MGWGGGGIKKIKYKFHSYLRWITSSCPCLYWAIWSFIRIQNSCGKRNHGGTDFSFKGIAGWPIKMKRLNVVVTGPQAALSDSFISGVLRWGLNRGRRGSAGDTLFPKSGRVNSEVLGTRGRGTKRKPKRASVCPSPNLLFVVHEYSLRTRLHWRFRVLTHGLLFITVVGRKLKKKKKEVRKLCEEVTARRYHPLPGQFFQKTHDSLHKYCRRNLAGQCPEVYPWNEKKKCKLFLLWYDLIWTTVIMKK